MIKLNKLSLSRLSDLTETRLATTATRFLIPEKYFTTSSMSITYRDLLPRRARWSSLPKDYSLHAELSIYSLTIIGKNISIDNFLANMIFLMRSTLLLNFLNESDNSIIIDDFYKSTT